jgi:hypothetical protein
MGKSRATVPLMYLFNKQNCSVYGYILAAPFQLSFREVNLNKVLARSIWSSGGVEYMNKLWTWSYCEYIYRRIPHLPFPNHFLDYNTSCLPYCWHVAVLNGKRLEISVVFNNHRLFQKYFLHFSIMNVISIFLPPRIVYKKVKYLSIYYKRFNI